VSGQNEQLTVALRRQMERAQRRRDAAERVDLLLAGVEYRNEIEREVRAELEAERTRHA
jgi:hypothetical protein